MRLLLTSLAAAVIVIGLASQASGRGSAPGIVAQAIDLAAPSPVEAASYRGRGRIVCGIRWQPFFNGFFWRNAPVHACWRT